MSEPAGAASSPTSPPALPHNRLGLNAPVTRLLAGGVVNHLGNGMVFPFLLIYLHQVRGIPLGTAGAVVSVMGIAGIAALPISGSLVDRFGALLILRGGVALSLVGYSMMPLVHVAWQALPVCVVIGIGSAVYFPAATTLLNGLVTEDERHHAYAMQRVAMNVGFGLGGLLGGAITRVDRPGTFTAVYLLDALTFAAYLLVVRPLPDTERTRSEHHVLAPVAFVRGLREAVVGRFARRLLALDLLIATMFTFGFELMPAHASASLGQSTTVIGVLFLANTATVTVLQLPVSRALRGRRRIPAFQLMGACMGALMALVLASGDRDAATVTMLLGIGVCTFGIGEAILGAVRGPLQAEVAPAGTLGRYTALSQAVHQSGSSLTRAAGGALLAASPAALWWLAVALAACIVGGASGLGRSAPEHLQRMRA